MSHMPERLKCDDDSLYIMTEGSRSILAAVYRDFTRPYDESVANAKAIQARLVACWNACAGIPTEDLEKANSLWDAMVSAEAASKAIAERNRWQTVGPQLAAALRRIIDELRSDEFSLGDLENIAWTALAPTYQPAQPDPQP